MANLNHVLTALRNGAVLHLSFVKGQSWELNDSNTSIRINARVARAALKRPDIMGAGDALFADIPAQTWRSLSQTCAFCGRRGVL
jgi:hypothetical protein